MKKLLEAFSFKTIQESARILKSILKSGFSCDDFIKFAKGEKNELLVLMEKEEALIKESLKAAQKEENTKAIDKKLSVQTSGKKKTVKSKFLVPGELVKMKGVVCSKCGDEVYTTAVCCGNPLKAQGFLRKTICSSCGLETGQK